MSYATAIVSRTPTEVLADTADEIADRGGDDKSFPETSTQKKLLDTYAEARAREEEIRVQLVYSGSISLVEQIPEEDGRDEWVELQSEGHFTNQRDPATYALHVFLIANAATGISRTFAPGQLRARFGAIDFLNVTKDDITEYAGSGTVAAGSTLNLLFEAQTAGSTGNVPAGYVTQLVTVFAGVTVSNPAIAGTGSSIYRSARDAERNASLLDRNVSRWGASSAGGSTGSIVEWLHESFPYANVTNTITKWYIDDTNPDGPGTTRLYVAPDAGTASVATLALIQDYMTLRRTSGSGSNGTTNLGILVLAASDLAVAFSATIKNSSNANAEADSQAVVTAINTAANLGAGTLYKSEVIRLLKSVTGTTDVPIDSLTFEDTVLEPGERLVLSATFTVVP